MDISDFQATQVDIAAYQSGTYQRQGVKPQSRKRAKSPNVKLDLPRPQAGEWFIKGPIPLDWLQIASRCGRRGVEVGLLLWYAAGWQNKHPVLFASSIRKQFGIGDKTTKRVLVQMQREGIIDVEFHRGRSPLVTLRRAEAPEAQEQRKPATQPDFDQITTI